MFVFPTQQDDNLFFNPDDSLDNFSDQSGLDYTDYVQALQVRKPIAASFDEIILVQDLKDEGRYIPPNVVASLPSLGQDPGRPIKIGQYNNLRFSGTN